MLVYYNKYKSSEIGFKDFHNQIINMPRADFSSVGYEHLQLLSKYLLFFTYNEQKKVYYNYKEIYELLLESYKSGKLRINNDFEEKYFFPYVNSDLDSAYGDNGVGRLFRHEMGIASFFELINSESKNRKKVNVSKCEEFVITPENLLDDLKRNAILSVNTKDNPFIKEIKGIRPNNTEAYRPSFAILEYIAQIDRGATDFELSILLGRVDEISGQNKILTRALSIGKDFPIEKSEQIDYFFRKMGWVNSEGRIFSYGPSQQPYFKFRVFILYMVNFGLLEETENFTFILTDYSKGLMNKELDPYLLDLANLLDKIEQIDHPNSVIDAVLNSRTLTLKNLLETEDDLVTKLGRRSILEKNANAKYGRPGKQTRNSLIMFFAKHLVSDTCSVTTSFTENGIIHNFNVRTFETSNGKFYSEGHHILELSKHNGPDVIENIILLDPNTHKLIHNGNALDLKNFYEELKKNNIIEIKRFENMIQRYNCLNKGHLKTLLNSGIIDDEGYIYLSNKINAQTQNCV